MANELTIDARIQYADAVGGSEDLQLLKALKSVVTQKWTHFKVSIATSETAIPLGPVAAPGYCLLINRDPTNYVDVKVAASGAIFARLDPDTAADGTGGCCLVKLGSGAVVPVAIANTAACLVEGVLFNT